MATVEHGHTKYVLRYASGYDGEVSYIGCKTVAGMKKLARMLKKHDVKKIEVYHLAVIRGV